MRGTVEDLQNIATEMNKFKWLLLNQSGSVLSRINEALLKLNEISKDDVVAMRINVQEYSGAFQENVASGIEPVAYFTADIRQMLYYLEQRILLGDDSDRGQGTATYIVNVLDLYIDAIKVMNQTYNGIGEQNSRYLPHRLLRDRDRMEYCESVFKNESEQYAVLQHKLDYLRSNDYPEYEGTPEWPGETITIVRHRINNISRLFNCSREYQSIVENTLFTIEETEQEIQATLNSQFGFIYETVLNNVREEVDIINGNITLLADMLHAYSENEMSKFELSNTLTTESLSSMEQTLDNALSKVTTHAFAVLAAEAESSKVNIKTWVHAGLLSMSSLVPYYDNNNIENFLRELNIWRRPVADLDTPDILRYSYGESETWRTWPRTVSLSQLLSGETDQELLVDIVNDYVNVLYGEMNEVEQEYINAKNSILAAFSQLVLDLQDFLLQCSIDKEFILTNFLQMDVYFSALKFESVAQQEAYGTMNFLSEVGGYMGLLIGASTLTLCEILDLVLYNLFLKCVDAGHRSRAISVLPTSNTVDNTEHGQRYIQEYSNFPSN